ncbi:MAG: hypothetical protein ABI626_00250 [Sphingomicrobium sp.]
MSQRPARRAGFRTRAAAAIGIGLIAAAGLALVAGRKPEAPAAVEARATNRPQLMLLTTLPLMFGDSFGLDHKGSPALSALEAHYTVVPVAVADRATLARGRLLLMAHPLAQPAEALVELDQWVRSGGRLLLLADPMLEWPSERPLGDSLRPPPAFADTGLLAHWGLRLDAPDERGPRQRELAGLTILTASPGALTGQRCAVSRDRLVAHCSVGKGKATIVADADFLDVDQLDGPVSNNLKAMVDELDALDR